MADKQVTHAVDAAIAAKGYVHPEVLVSTQWVADHLNDPNVRIVESNEDILLYDQGHVPGAIQIDWVGDLNDKLRRDYLDRKSFSELMSRDGIGSSDPYGDQVVKCRKHFIAVETAQDEAATQPQVWRRATFRRHTRK